MSAASDLAAMVRMQIPDWAETFDDDRPDGRWTWRPIDPDYGDRFVVIDATVMPLTKKPERVAGPTILGYACDVTTTVRWPGMVDGTDMRRVLAVLIAAGVLPDDDGMTH